MKEEIYILTIVLPLLTILLIFAIRAFSAVQQAKLRHANDEAYRQLAEKAIAAQTESAAALALLTNQLADLQSRTASVEKILKDVE